MLSDHLLGMFSQRGWLPQEVSRREGAGAGEVAMTTLNRDSRNMLQEIRGIRSARNR